MLLLQKELVLPHVFVKRHASSNASGQTSFRVTPNNFLGGVFGGSTPCRSSPQWSDYVPRHYKGFAHPYVHRKPHGWRFEVFEVNQRRNQGLCGFQTTFNATNWRSELKICFGFEWKMTQLFKVKDLLTLIYILSFFIDILCIANSLHMFQTRALWCCFLAYLECLGVRCDDTIWTKTILKLVRVVSSLAKFGLKPIQITI